MRVVQTLAARRFLAIFGQYGVREGDVVLGIERDGRIVGAVAYTDFNGASMAMHCAGKGAWLSRRVLEHLFHYPFVVAGCKTVIATVPSDNARALSLNARLGFKELARVPDADPDGDIVIMAMRRAECRWIGETYGQETRHAAAGA